MGWMMMVERAEAANSVALPRRVAARAESRAKPSCLRLTPESLALVIALSCHRARVSTKQLAAHTKHAGQMVTAELRGCLDFFDSTSRSWGLKIESQVLSSPDVAEMQESDDTLTSSNAHRLFHHPNGTEKMTSPSSHGDMARSKHGRRERDERRQTTRKKTNYMQLR